MNLRSTLPVNTAELDPKPSPVVEIPLTVNTIEEANAVFDKVFGDGTETAPAAPTSTALVPVTPTAVAPSEPNDDGSIHFADDEFGVLKGDWTSDDIAVPNLRIVAGSGKLVEQFQSGSTIFADEVLLAPPDPRKPENNKSFYWAPITMTKSFRKVISQEDHARGLRPRFASSAAEVQSMGGTSMWIGNTRPSWDPTAAVSVIIRKPEWLDHPGFGIDVGDVTDDGKPVLYALGIYYAAGTAFRKTVTLINSQARQTLKVPLRGADGKPKLHPVTNRPMMAIMLHRNWWSWSTTTEPAGKFTVTVPVVTMKSEQTSEGLRAFISEILVGMPS